MKIPIKINGNSEILECRAEESLLYVLRHKRCLSVKTGCEKGICGCCTILLDGKPVNSCKIPVAIVRNCDVITLEYFSKTEEYEIIMDGFKKAGINLCGYCNSAKIFNAHKILCEKRKLTRDEIKNYVSSLAPCCTDTDTLVNGIIYALKIARERGTEING